jgi:hypothetical protein
VNIQAAMTTAFNKAIATLGLPASLSPAKGGAAVNLGEVGFASLGRQDEALVNAYGPAAKVITIRADKTGSVTPAKFDTVTIGAEKYVLAAVHPIHSGTAIIGWKCYSKQP